MNDVLSGFLVGQPSRRPERKPMQHERKDDDKNEKPNHDMSEPMSKEFHEQLQMGVKVEMEHTAHQKMAEKIARDHLKEDPIYYTKLKKCDL